MSEWTSPVQPVRCKVDLTAPLTVRRERGVLVQGDKNANAIVAEVYQANGVPYDLTGSTVTLTFVRPDKLAVSPIKAEITGNVAVMTLTEACYRFSGLYGADVTLKNGEMDRTIVRMIGDIISTQNDGTVDDEQLFPTPEELLETLEKVERARHSAEAAADRANAAAARAEQLQIDASGLAGDSNNLGGKPPEYYLPAVNLLDNSWFGGTIVNGIKQGLVNQRGYVSGTIGTNNYIIDRWILQEGTALIFNDGFARLKGAYSIYQKGRLLAAGSYTLAAKMRAAGGNRSLQIVVQSDSAGLNTRTNTRNSGDWVLITLNFVLSQNVTDLIVFPTNSGDPSVDTDLEWIALYPGTYTAETLPPFVPPDPMLELEKCRRYLWEFGVNMVFTGFVMAGGVKINTQISQRQMSIAKPSLYGNAAIMAAWAVYVDGVGVNPSNVSVSSNKGGVYVELTLANAVNAIRPATVEYNGGNSGGIDANL